MYTLNTQHVAGKSFNQGSVKTQCQSNISKKAFTNDHTPFDYVNKDGSNQIRFPKTGIYEYMFSQEMRGEANPSTAKSSSAIALSAHQPLTSIYSVQRLHDIFVPGCTKRGPGLNDNEVQQQRWSIKKDQIESKMSAMYGALNNEAQLLAQRHITQSGVQGEQLVFQQFNHLALENMLQQIPAPRGCQPCKNSTVFYSGIDQPSLQVK